METSSERHGFLTRRINNLEQTVLAVALVLGIGSVGVVERPGQNRPWQSESLIETLGGYGRILPDGTLRRERTPCHRRTGLGTGEQLRVRPLPWRRNSSPSVPASTFSQET
jgi:hypothetical protein